MDAVEFLKAQDYMCKSLQTCRDCPLFRNNECTRGQEECYEEVVTSVEKWWKDNKPKTNFEWYKEWLESQGFEIKNLSKSTCPIAKAYRCPAITYESCTECRKWWDEIHKE